VSHLGRLVRPTGYQEMLDVAKMGKRLLDGGIYRFQANSYSRNDSFGTSACSCKATARPAPRITTTVVTNLPEVGRCDYPRNVAFARFSA
jgi:hypothetical protein